MKASTVAALALARAASGLVINSTATASASSTFACNPAHSYGPSVTCTTQGGTLTLVSFAVDKPTPTPAPTTFACNPAHSYGPGVTCTSQSGSLTLVSFSVDKPISTPAPTSTSSSYACNPAHSYPNNQVCTSKDGSLTLVSRPASKPEPAPSSFACNPAHQYPAGQVCTSENGSLTLKSKQPVTKTEVVTELVTYCAQPTTLTYAPGKSTVVTKPTTITVKDCPCTVTKTNTVALGVPSYTPAPSAQAPPAPPAPKPSAPAAPAPAPSKPAENKCPALSTVTVTVQAGQPQYTPAPAPPSSSTKPSVSVGTPVYTPSPSGKPTDKPTGKACPVTLAGAEYQFPHLIVKSQDKRLSAPQYNGTIDKDTTSFFNFDIPQSYAGKTCDVVFALPTQAQLETSSFSLTGNGSLDFFQRSAPVKASVDISEISAASATKIGSWKPAAGTAFTAASGKCEAGKTVGYQIGAAGDVALNYFQDYNPCPIGLYVLAH